MGRKKKKGGYYNEEYFFRRAFDKEPPHQIVIEKELTDELFERNYDSHRNPTVQVQNLLDKSPFEKEDIVKEEIEEPVFESQNSTNAQLEKESIDQEKEDSKVNREDSKRSQEKAIEELYPQWEASNCNDNGDIDLCINEKLINQEKALVNNENDKIKEGELNNDIENNEHDDSVNFYKSITEDYEDFDKMNNNPIENEIEIDTSIHIKENNIDHEENQIIQNNRQETKPQISLVFKEVIENSEKEEEEIKDNNAVTRNSNEIEVVKGEEEIPLISNPIEQLKDAIEINQIERNIKEEKKTEEESTFVPQIETEVIPNNIQHLDRNEIAIDNREEIAPQSNEAVQEISQDTNNEIIEDSPSYHKPPRASNKTNRDNNINETLQKELTNNVIIPCLEENNYNEAIRISHNSKKKNKSIDKERKENQSNSQNNTNITKPLSNRNVKCQSMVIDDSYVNAISLTEYRDTIPFNRENRDEYRKTDYDLPQNNNIKERKVFHHNKVPIISPPENKDEQCCIII